MFGSKLQVKMGGGDLNMKKHFHPLTMENLERVWKAEEKKRVEEERIVQMKQELAEERQREAYQKQAVESGLQKKKEEKLDWMYSHMQSVNTDAYLLGKKIDKNVESMKEEEKNIDVVPVVRKAPVIKASEILAKVKEDPLFLIKKKEEENRKELAHNPIKMKKLRAMLEKDVSNLREVQKLKKSKKKHKRQRERSSSSEREHRSRKKEMKAKESKHARVPSPEHSKKYKDYDNYRENIHQERSDHRQHRIDNEENYARIQKKEKYSDSKYEDNHRQKKDYEENGSQIYKKERHHESNSQPKERTYNSAYRNHETEHKSYDKNERTSDYRKDFHRRNRYSDDEEEKPYHKKERRESSPPKRKRHRDLSEESNSDNERKGKHTHKNEKSNKPNKSKSKHKKRQDSSASDSDEELEAKRLEMMKNAEWRQNQRVKNFSQYKKETKAEEDLMKDTHNVAEEKARFIKKMQLDSYSSKHTASVEDRIRRTIHSKQRTNASLDKKFTAR